MLHACVLVRSEDGKQCYTVFFSQATASHFNFPPGTIRARIFGRSLLGLWVDLDLDFLAEETKDA